MIEYSIRLATAADAAIVAHHRVRMFEDMGRVSAADSPRLRSATERRAAGDLASGAYVGWLAESDGEVVAGAGLLLHQYYPFVDNFAGRPTAYVLNVYTEPAHRRRGLARRLMLAILEWCRAHDIPRASLHASPEGKLVYEALGFQPTNEMRVTVR